MTKEEKLHANALKRLKVHPGPNGARDLLYGGLTKKEHDFIMLYIKTGNGTRAALEVFDTKDYKTANAIASEYLTKPIIISWIADYLAKYATENDIMRELWADVASGDKQLRINALNLIARIKAMVSERHINVEEQKKDYANITYGDFAEPQKPSIDAIS